MMGHVHHKVRPRQSLNIEFGPGGVTLDAAALADRFGMSAEAMRSLMDQHLMRGMVEKGEGVDAGTWRLSMRYGNRMWRAVLMEDGELREEVGVASVMQAAKGRSDAGC